MLLNYLKLYNVFACSCWVLFFIFNVANGFSTTVPIVLTLLTIAQGSAVLEIIHAMLKWVKSPWFITLAQVFSRIFVLILINLLWVNDSSLYFKIGFVLISIAWTMADVVRYLFYSFALQGQENKWVTFLRYRLFKVLYPMGVLGEVLIGIAYLNSTGWQWIKPFNLLIIVVFGSYLYFFPKLYLYMWNKAKEIKWEK